VSSIQDATRIPMSEKKKKAAAKPAPKAPARSLRRRRRQPAGRTRKPGHGRNPAPAPPPPSIEDRSRAPAARKPPPASRRPARKPAGLSILMVSSEAHPFAKTGGLAEVVGSLPLALARLGHRVTIVCRATGHVEAGEAPGEAVTLSSASGPRTSPSTAARWLTAWTPCSSMPPASTTVTGCTASGVEDYE
jgi:hypothetical protein